MITKEIFENMQLIFVFLHRRHRPRYLGRQFLICGIYSIESILLSILLLLLGDQNIHDYAELHFYRFFVFSKTRKFKF